MTKFFMSFILHIVDPHALRSFLLISAPFLTIAFLMDRWKDRWKTLQGLNAVVILSIFIGTLIYYGIIGR